MHKSVHKKAQLHQHCWTSHSYVALHQNQHSEVRIWSWSYFSCSVWNWAGGLTVLYFKKKKKADFQLNDRFGAHFTAYAQPDFIQAGMVCTLCSSSLVWCNDRLWTQDGELSPWLKHWKSCLFFFFGNRAVKWLNCLFHDSFPHEWTLFLQAVLNKCLNSTTCLEKYLTNLSLFYV